MLFSNLHCHRKKNTSYLFACRRSNADFTASLCQRSRTVEVSPAGQTATTPSRHSQSVARYVASMVQIIWSNRIQDLYCITFWRPLDIFVPRELTSELASWLACTQRHTVACMHGFSHILRWSPVLVVWFISEWGAFMIEQARKICRSTDHLKHFLNGYGRQRVKKMIFSMIQLPSFSWNEFHPIPLSHILPFPFYSFNLFFFNVFSFHPSQFSNTSHSFTNVCISPFVEFAL